MDPKKISQHIRKPDEWTTLKEKVFEFPNGTEQRFMIQYKGVIVFIFGVTVEGNIVLVKQWRPGPEKWLYEIPAGVVDKGEDLLDGAKREFLEETGFTGDFEFVSDYYLSPYAETKAHIFCAQNCKKISDQNLDEGELMEVVEVSLKELKKMIQIGNFLHIGWVYRVLDYLKLL